MLATVKQLLKVTKDDNIIKLYGFSKGGKDIVDQKIDNYTTKEMSGRWSMVSFYYLLDTARVNASTEFSLNNIADSKIGWNLANKLINPFVANRPRNGL